MKQMVSSPTHVLGNTFDLVCTNNLDDIHGVEVVSPGLSDHSIILVHFKQTADTITQKPRTIKLYKKANVEAFREETQKTIDELRQMEDPGEMWEIFRNSLRKSINQYVPTKVIKPRHPSMPEWANKRVLKLMSKQRKAYNKAKRSADDLDIAEYKKQKSK